MRTEGKQLFAKSVEATAARSPEKLLRAQIILSGAGCEQHRVNKAGGCSVSKPGSG